MRNSTDSRSNHFLANTRHNPAKIRVETKEIMTYCHSTVPEIASLIIRLTLTTGISAILVSNSHTRQKADKGR